MLIKDNKFLNQFGVASIIVVMIMMVVISSIVVGMSIVVRNNQTSTTNNLLNNQAFYAAETGINDAIYALKNGYQLKPGDNNNCNSFISNSHINNILNSASTVYFNCLEINQNPSSISSPIFDNRSTVFPISPTAPLSQLNFSWSPDSSSGALSSCPSTATVNNLPSTWSCPYAIIRLDVYKYSASDFSSSNIANALDNNTNTIFIIPTISSSGPTSLNLTFPNSNYHNPYLLAANCNSSNCQTSFNFSSNFNGYVRLSSIYSNSPNITITANKGVTFSNAQILIDSTGVAQNISQRVEVRIPLTNNQGYPLPINALTTTNSICKSYSIYGSNANASVTPEKSCTIS